MKIFVRLTGVVWIALAVYAVFVAIRKPLASGMAAGIFLMSIAMAYESFSGQFDPLPPGQEPLFYEI